VAGCGAWETLGLYAIRPGGGGIGIGEPLAVRVANPGGGGIGIGEPLAVRVANPGGGGIGIGEPLAVRMANPGGGGIGIGEPLKTATDTAAERLLDKCLPELLTGSTIKIVQTNRPKRTNMFFVMDEPLLAQP
jgi:hypothetical protein